MILEKLVAGHPLLSGGGFTSLQHAATATTISVEQLLREAEQGNLSLFVRVDGLLGHALPDSELDWDYGPGPAEVIVPQPSQMNPLAVHQAYSGLLQVRDTSAVAAALIMSGQAECVLFDVISKPGHCFAPERKFLVSTSNVELLTQEVERIRAALAARVSKAHLRAARLASPDPHVARHTDKHGMRFSKAIDAYMEVRALKCNADQARRVRGALELFVELEGDLTLGEIDSSRLEHFRDVVLPTVPANENKIRLQFGTTSVTESIRAVNGSDWPRLSLTEQVKRIAWLASMFKWLRDKEWLARNPAGVLVQESKAKSLAERQQKESDKDLRDAFSPEDLALIFSTGCWFRTGRGELTKAGTYREYCPFYYWLPLLGLYTGGRINELSQLYLSDICQSPTGTWFYNIAMLDDDGKKKRRKNKQSLRRVPIHPALLKAGLIEWKYALEGAGYRRLFPELRHDATKGFGKAATRWFGGYLLRLGMQRDNRKVFHSFRKTLVTHCINRLKLGEHETAQISGHARDSSVMIKHYAGHEVPDYLVDAIARVDFNLPEIAPFDCAAGLKAVADALARKNSGLGAKEDA